MSNINSVLSHNWNYLVFFPTVIAIFKMFWLFSIRPIFINAQIKVKTPLTISWCYFHEPVKSYFFFLSVKQANLKLKLWNISGEWHITPGMCHQELGGKPLCLQRFQSSREVLSNGRLSLTQAHASQNMYILQAEHFKPPLMWTWTCFGENRGRREESWSFVCLICSFGNSKHKQSYC